MVVRSKTGRLVAAALLASVTGCKNGFEIPIWNPFAKPSPALQSSGDGYVQPNAPPAPRTEEFGWDQPLKKVGAAVSAPFRKTGGSEPKVSKESDATSLASNNVPGPGIHVDLAKMEEKAGHTEMAIKQYRLALEADENNLPALLGLARLYDRQSNYEEAIELYRKAATAHPDDAAALNDLGLCYARAGKLTDSLNSLQRAVALEPNKVLYRNNLATVLVETGRSQEAYRTLRPAHGDAIAHYNVGFLLSKRGEKAEALEHFESASRLDPSFRQAQQWVEVLRNEGPTATAARPGDGVVASTSKDLLAPKAPSDKPPVEESAIDEPIATPYVPQSDVPKRMTPVSRPTVVEDEAPSGSSNIRRLPAAEDTAEPDPAPSTSVPAASIPTEPKPAAAQPAADEAGPRLIGNEQARRARGQAPSNERYELRDAAPAPPATGLTAKTPRPPLNAGLPPLPDDAPSTTAPAAATPRTASGTRYPASRY